MKFTNSTTFLIAIILLGLSLLIAFFSSRNVSLTVDELAHIPAGYSYLSQGDYRLNPEHPPLVKDLSALPLMFLDTNFPANDPYWTEKIDYQQWRFGYKFMFELGNDADQIIFWARLPMLLLLLLLGWFIFFWVRQLGGNKPALLALTLFVFSPTFLAHGRLVTTDVAAALGALIAIYFWVKFLKNPAWKSIFLAGIILGISLCLKFSLILLIPVFALITLIYACLQDNNLEIKPRKIFKYIGLAILVGLIAVIFIIWPIYKLHMINYPSERQIHDTFSPFITNPPLIKNFFTGIIQNPLLRPLAHYLFGLMCAVYRTIGGNVVYFLGEVSRQGWRYYFPAMYLLKIPLSFHILTFLTLSLWVWSLKNSKAFKKEFQNFRLWILRHFSEFTLLVFFCIYWIVSITSKLNIGVRHILPILPIVYILVSINIFPSIETIKRKKIKIALQGSIVLLLIWYISSSLLAFPHYLSYYNEIAGGPKNGYKYAVDSNYDWGQDLKRLADFVEKNNIEKIKLYYFGGDHPDYRLKNKMVYLDPEKGPQKGWLAVSATYLQLGRAKPTPSYQKDTTFFNWLNNYQPIARAGNSIFIYYIK